MEALSEHTAWINYLGGQFAVAEVDEETAEAWERQVEAVALVGAAPAKGEVMVARAAQRLSDDVTKAREARQKAYAYRKLMSVLFTNAERNQAIISREITRRVGRDGPTRRESRGRP